MADTVSERGLIDLPPEVIARFDFRDRAARRVRRVAWSLSGVGNLWVRLVGEKPVAPTHDDRILFQSLATLSEAEVDEVMVELQHRYEWVGAEARRLRIAGAIAAAFVGLGLGYAALASLTGISPAWGDFCALPMGVALLWWLPSRLKEDTRAQSRQIASFGLGALHASRAVQGDRYVNRGEMRSTFRAMSTLRSKISTLGQASRAETGTAIKARKRVIDRCRSVLQVTLDEYAVKPTDKWGTVDPALARILAYCMLERWVEIPSLYPAAPDYKAGFFTKISGLPWKRIFGGVTAVAALAVPVVKIIVVMKS